jgi:plastocyanin
LLNRPGNQEVAMRGVSRAVLSLAVIAAAACGGGGGSTPTSPSAPAPGTVTISIRAINGNQSFSPNPAEAGGRMVVFRNDDSIPHRVRLNDGSIDTGTLAPGGSSQPVQMPSAGTNYHCSLHPTMIGAVSNASGAAPPPCEGEYC